MLRACNTSQYLLMLHRWEITGCCFRQPSEPLCLKGGVTEEEE